MGLTENYLVGMLSEISVVLLLGALALGAGLLVDRRRHRRTRRFLGLGSFDDRVDVLISSIGISEFKDLAGIRHGSKVDAVDYKELVGVNRLTEFLRGPRRPEWLDELLELVGIGGRQMKTAFDVRPAPHDGRLQTSSTILVGGGVFNSVTRQLHEDRNIARIVVRENGFSVPILSENFGSRLSVIALPGQDESPFEGREIVNPDNLIERRDLALIQKVVQRDNAPVQTVIVIAGLGSGGTVASLQFVIRHWDKICLMDKLYHHGFEIVLSWWSPNTSYVPSAHEIEVVSPRVWPLSDGEAHPRSDLRGPAKFTKTLERSGLNLAAASRPKIFLGYDGVISAISPDSDAAAPIPGVVKVLAELSDLKVQIVIVSSRNVDYLKAHLHQVPGIEIVGNRGLASEYLGVRKEHETMPLWRQNVLLARDRFNAMLAELGAAGQAWAQVMEGSLALHYRSHPERRADVLALAEHLKAEYGFRLGHGRMVIEMYPDVDDVDKGAVVAARLDDCDWALFLGDSSLDVSAFKVVSEYDRHGCGTYSIGVKSLESTPGLFHSCDATVDGPTQMLAYLRMLRDFRRKIKYGPVATRLP